jgi:hypothetical protein
MSRTAEYAIKGYIYQFLVTLSKLLDTSNGEITVEGVVEDIDVLTPTGLTAYQCKYHETKSKFTLSAIYKPILQMLCHYDKNPSSLIQYRLHAHFPNEKVGSKKVLSQIELDEVIATTAANLQNYLKDLSAFTDKVGFLSRFEIHFGTSYDDLESSIIVALCKEGLSTEDVKEILYPNAVHKIAEISINPDVNQRKIKKDQFVDDLKSIKKTAISRWTKELQSFYELLKKRRQQLRDDLNKNYRKRCFIVDSAYLQDFDSKITLFIKEFVDKYNSKAKNSCPTFSLMCHESMLNQIWKFLTSKGVNVERGYIGGELDVDYFLREPMVNVKENKASFRVRICNHNTDFDKMIDKGKYDDIFIISENIPGILKGITDTNVEHLQTKELDQINYLLSLKNSL